MRNHWPGCVPILCAALAVGPVRGHTDQSGSQDPATRIDALLKTASDQMYVKGQFKEASETSTQALELSRRASDQLRTLRSLHSLGSSYFYMARFAEALDLEQEGVGLARQLADRKLLQTVLNGKASILRAMGRFEEAVQNFDEAAALSRELLDLPMQWTITRNIGVLYMEMGDLDKAEAPLKDALRIARELKTDRWKDQTRDGGKVAGEVSLETLGNWETGRERYTAAADYYEQALADKPEIPALTAEILHNLAFAREKLGESQTAIDLSQRAISLSGNPPQPLMLLGLAVSQESVGQLPEALASAQRALTFVRESGGNPQYEWMIEGRIARVQRALGRSDVALSTYQSALNSIELLRATALSTESGRAFALATRRAVYEEAADLLHDLGREPEALEMAERARARAFLDVLVESRKGVVTDRTPEQEAREDTLAARISARQIQNTLLDDQTALVEYLLGERRSLAWVVTKQSLIAIVLPPRKEIEEHVTAYRTVLRQPVSTLTLRQSVRDVSRAGGWLYRSIFQPTEAAFGTSRKVIVIPDGGLDYLPFEALVTSSRASASGDTRLSYVAEKFSMVYGPSASALLAVQAMNRPAKTPSKTLLAVGDPVAKSSRTSQRRSAADDYAERGFSLARLPYARNEVLSIVNLFPASQRRYYLGADAREETIKNAGLDDYRFIHFASHGFLDEVRPDRSGILLSSSRSNQDGILQFGEIMRLKLNADLVTLSACSTGLGKLINGEGILGLTRAIFYAGARNVAVSLWNVNDSATATLMTTFYRNLKQGVPTGEAMRQAKLRLLHSSQRTWQHPYFWAAFVIAGEGR